MTAITLDERIAFALDPSTEQLSSDLLALCKEVERMSRLHEVAARQSRDKSIDPSHADYAAARGAAEDSEFLTTRYKVASEKLRALHEKTVLKEQQAAWSVDADVVEMKVAQLADQFLEIYPTATKALVDLFRLMAQLDVEVTALNARAPWGVKDLQKVELVARGITEFRNLCITEKTVLPPLLMGRASGDVENLWPPKPFNATLAYALMVENAIRNAPPPPSELERAEASRRHIAQGEADERERERLRSEQAARV